MKIRIDGVVLAAETDDGRYCTLGDLLADVEAGKIPPDRVIVGLEIDGKTVDDPEAADAATLSGAHSVDILTDDRVRFCRNMLHAIRSHLDALKKTLADVAEWIAEGRKHDGLVKLADCMDAWDAIRQGIAGVMSVADPPPGVMMVHGRSYADADAALADILRQVREAVRARDMVSVGDLAEYELLPHVQVLSSYVQCLENSIE